MPKDAVFTVELEIELRGASQPQPTATDRPGPQLVHEFMREVIARRRQEREHDTWFFA